MDKTITGLPPDVLVELKKQSQAAGLTLTAYLRVILIEAARNGGKVSISVKRQVPA